MSLRALLPAAAFALLSACEGGDTSNDPGPKPGADVESEVSSRIGQILQRNQPRASAKGFRFAQPKKDQVARWLFDPEEDARPHAFGYFTGWRIDFWYTPEYESYPEQPERHDMALYGDGKLRGLFAEGVGDAPLQLDQWSPRWVDTTWKPVPDPRDVAAKR
jgi:hypothetical protein